MIQRHIWSDDQTATMSLAGCGVFMFLSLFWAVIYLGSNAAMELTSASSQPEFLFGSSIISLVAFGGTVWMLGVRRHPMGWRSVGFRATTLNWMLISIAIGVAFVPFSVAISLMAQNLITGMSFRDSLALPPAEFTVVPIGEFLVVFTSIAVIVPFAEEMFFRGVLFKWLRTRTSFLVAAGISAIAFGAVHFSVASIISLSLAGFLCALAYEHSKSLWTAIAIHAGNNGIIVILYYFVFKTPIIL